MSTKLPVKTRSALKSYLDDVPAGPTRAQLINILNLELDDNETIAERIARDHSTIDAALRAMHLVHQAGAATHKTSHPGVFGVFTFEDGSQY